MTDVGIELGEWFDTIWHDTQGWVYLPIHTPPYGPTDWRKLMFEWPRQRSGVIKHVLKHTTAGANVYFSPGLFKTNRPEQANFLGSWCLWVDFDGNAPETWAGDVPEPSIEIQSSGPGHVHCYWLLDEFVTAKANAQLFVVEERNRALAYTLKADTSGWDANQVLRPPFTHNYKRDMPVVPLRWEH